MKIHKNIGNIDFMIRIVVLLFFVYLSHKVSPWFYLLVAFEFFIVVTRWCFAYDLFKINTLGGKK